MIKTIALVSLFAALIGWIVLLAWGRSPWWAAYLVGWLAAVSGAGLEVARYDDARSKR